MPKECRLNASALSISSKSLIVPLSLSFIRSDFSSENFSFDALLDSGSTDCVLDKKFVLENHISTLQISLVNLQLFDGSLSLL